MVRVVYGATEWFVKKADPKHEAPTYAKKELLRMPPPVGWVQTMSITVEL